ncbi:MAG: phosphoribosylglycinamide formyltransferase [Candidatus Cloacimonetes bacterium]|nr:phosphoribosylglycinamide formyltransferase [Candidatus Cloacimonadota bacterium]
MEEKKIVIFISGRGSNMEAILQNVEKAILKDICEVPLVLSNKIDAPGIKKAKKYGVRAVVIPSRKKKRSRFEAEVIRELEKIDFDFIVLAGFMKILSKHFTEKYERRIINIHPADTKQYQGPAGYEWAYENNLSQTYITVHYVDEGVDTGDIIAQKKIDLSGLGSLEDIKKRGLTHEHRFYSKVIAELITGKKFE